MEDKLFIAIIAASSSIFGAVVSSIVSFFISRQSTLLRKNEKVAEYLTDKLKKLESLNNDIIELNLTRINSKKHSEYFDTLAITCNSLFELSSKILLKIDYYLEIEVYNDLHTKMDNININLAINKAVWLGLIEGKKAEIFGQQVYENISQNILSFGKEIKSIINIMLRESTERLEFIYGLKK